MDGRGCRPLPQATTGAPGLTPAGQALLWAAVGVGVSSAGEACSWAARHLICPAGTRRWGLGPGPVRASGTAAGSVPCPVLSACPRGPSQHGRCGVSSLWTPRLHLCRGPLPPPPSLPRPPLSLSRPCRPSPSFCCACLQLVLSLSLSLSSHPCSFPGGINSRCAGGAWRRRGKAPPLSAPLTSPLPAATFCSKK